MSRLYKTYMSLKIQNSKQLYLFKCGIFYIFLHEDAKIMSKILNLKLTNLNSVIVKCGFPVSKLDKYISLIKKTNYSIKIIDIANNVSFLPKEYKLDTDINKLLNKIASINIDDLLSLIAIISLLLILIWLFIFMFTL